MMNPSARSITTTNTASGGFKLSDALATYQKLGNTTSRGRDVRHSFFAGSAVKSIGENHRSPIAGRLAEIAATRGSCGKNEMKA